MTQITLDLSQNKLQSELDFRLIVMFTLIVTVGVGGTVGSILNIPEASLPRPMPSAFNETD